MWFYGDVDLLSDLLHWYSCRICMHAIFVWVFSRCSSFFPLSKDMYVWFIGDFKLLIGVNVCLSLYFSPVIDWWSVQGVPHLSINDRWLDSSTHATVKRKGGQNNGGQCKVQHTSTNGTMFCFLLFRQNTLYCLVSHAVDLLEWEHVVSPSCLPKL